MTLTECTRQNTCYDCDNTKCWHCGKKEADCPKYHCDRSNEMMLDCEHCEFIDKYLKGMKEEYGRAQNDLVLL